MKWSQLNNHPIIEDVANEWQSLIHSHGKELIYHKYLKEHASLFLVSPSADSFFAVSKLKLGSVLELDFAVAHEGYSEGLQWELIEIEKPQDAPYNNDGTPSAALTRATQQIRDWKAWISSSREESRKLFSIWNVRPFRNPNFRFKIIIGTRNNSEKWLDKRNQYAQENNIEIRSFDSLTDALRRRVFLDMAHLYNGDWDKRNGDICIDLANPFVEAFTDSEWKSILEESGTRGDSHFTSKIAKIIIAKWRINKQLLEQFLLSCKNKVR